MILVLVTAFIAYLQVFSCSELCQGSCANDINAAKAEINSSIKKLKLFQTNCIGLAEAGLCHTHLTMMETFCPNTVWNIKSKVVTPHQNYETVCKLSSLIAKDFLHLKDDAYGKDSLISIKNEFSTQMKKAHKGARASTFPFFSVKWKTVKDIVIRDYKKKFTKEDGKKFILTLIDLVSALEDLTSDVSVDELNFEKEFYEIFTKANIDQIKEYFKVSGIKMIKDKLASSGKFFSTAVKQFIPLDSDRSSEFISEKVIDFIEFALQCLKNDANNIDYVTMSQFLYSKNIYGKIYVFFLKLYYQKVDCAYTKNEMYSALSSCAETGLKSGPAKKAENATQAIEYLTAEAEALDSCKSLINTYGCYPIFAVKAMRSCGNVWLHMCKKDNSFIKKTSSMKEALKLHKDKVSKVFDTCTHSSDESCYVSLEDFKNPISKSCQQDSTNHNSEPTGETTVEVEPTKTDTNKIKDETNVVDDDDLKKEETDDSKIDDLNLDTKRAWECYNSPKELKRIMLNWLKLQDPSCMSFLEKGFCKTHESDIVKHCPTTVKEVQTSLKKKLLHHDLFEFCYFFSSEFELSSSNLEFNYDKITNSILEMQKMVDKIPNVSLQMLSFGSMFISTASLPKPSSFLRFINWLIEFNNKIVSLKEKSIYTFPMEQVIEVAISGYSSNSMKPVNNQKFASDLAKVLPKLLTMLKEIIQKSPKDDLIKVMVKFLEDANKLPELKPIKNNYIRFIKRLLDTPDNLISALQIMEVSWKDIDCVWKMNDKNQQLLSCEKLTITENNADDQILPEDSAEELYVSVVNNISKINACEDYTKVYGCFSPTLHLALPACSAVWKGKCRSAFIKEISNTSNTGDFYVLHKYNFTMNKLVYNKCAA